MPTADVCPRCGAACPPGAAECGECGVVFAKWRPGAPPRRSPSPLAARAAATASVPEWGGVPRAGWRATAVGAGVALVVSFLPFVSFLLHPIVTLVHEIGHTAVLWLYGYPAIPAFDFGHGGGVTMSQNERSIPIVGAVVGGVAFFAWTQRESPSRRVLAGAAFVVYVLFFGGAREAWLISVMGHGGEIAFAGLFLYRALTGWGVRVAAERPLYAFLAFYILFRDLSFAWALAGSAYQRSVYQEGKGGLDHDFVTAGAIMGWTLAGVARAFAVAVLGVLPLTWWAAAARRRLGAVAEDEEEG